MQKTMKNAKNFGIKLASNETWQLISTPETNEWLDKFCAIMELEEYTESEDHKIIFLKNLLNNYNTNCLDLNEIRMFNSGPLRIYKCQSSPHIICEIGGKGSLEMESLKMAQSLYPVYMEVLYQGGLPLHAALIEKNGIGVAIAAPGGTGKSTCARRIPHPWIALCDDEVLIVRDKNDVYRAHPFPTWSRCNMQEPGETWDVQAHVPISAIFFLKRSEKDNANLLSFSQSAQLIYKLSFTVFNRIAGSVDQDESIIIKKLTFENACNIAKDIPAFILEASLEGRFWEAIDRALSLYYKEGIFDAGTQPNTH